MNQLDRAARVHQFLMSPVAYPDQPSTIAMKETHTSWVYLTERYVYKQKKPVTFEFLDFSSLEQRKHFCELELTLNRRFSPDVYLGVVPVSLSTNGGYKIKAGPNIVEWLVKMTRLDESHTLESLIQRGQLRTRELSQLSECLLQFYSDQAPALLRSEEYLHCLSRHVDANRDDLLEAIGGWEEAIQFATNAQQRCLELEADAFLHRVADGRVVDGHGDLRPEHIYLRRTRPAIIDCIEFNAEYRTNDVVDELSFLAMECDRLGAPDVGESILDAYLQASTDTPRAFLSTFYKCYRACVRAKVTALRAIQAPADHPGAPADMAREYLELATKYARDLGGELVILVGGLSGTGKSTLARALQEVLHAKLLRTDLIRGELYASSSTNGKYSAEGRRLVYQEMVSRLPHALRCSPTVILDGTFDSNESRSAVVEQARRLRAHVLQVQCECSHEEARQRIANRIQVGGDASEATLELPAEQAGRYEPPLAGVRICHVNTTLATPGQVDSVLTHVRDLIGELPC